MQASGTYSRATAHKNEKHRAAVPMIQLVSFHLSSEEYALDILRVQEIIRMQDLTRVPNSPPFVEGVINLRGRVIPVVGLRKRFGLDPLPADKHTRIVVVEVHGTVVGLVVDSVSEVLRVAADTIEPPPRLGKVEREYVSGVGKLENRLLLLLDVDHLLSGHEQDQVGQVTRDTEKEEGEQA